MTADKSIDPQTEARAVAALKTSWRTIAICPRSRARGWHQCAARVAKNAKDFIAKAEAALGFPIEVIAGREEARLIYLGVAQSLPPTQNSGWWWTSVAVPPNSSSATLHEAEGTRQSLHGLRKLLERYFPVVPSTKGA